MGSKAAIVMKEASNIVELAIAAVEHAQYGIAFASGLVINESQNFQEIYIIDF
jgi:hypothetical protein